MAMAFNKSWQDHLVGEAIVDFELTPPFQRFDRPGPQDAPVAHRHMRGERLVGIHGNDATGGIDDSAHGSCYLRGDGSCEARTATGGLRNLLHRWTLAQAAWNAASMTIGGNMLRRTFISALGLAAAAPAFADTWPSRQIKVIVPYPPGGPTDISSRIVLEKAAQLLGQPILFDNKGGASGMLGAEIAKTQPADGYTFLATTVAMLAITRHLQPIPIDPDKDFATVARMSTSWMALAVHPSVPANTLAEFVAYVKANPGKVNFGSAGLGTITQLFGEMLNIEAGIKMVHVPYKGSAQATQDLLGGQIQAQFDQTVLPHILA